MLVASCFESDIDSPSLVQLEVLKQYLDGGGDVLVMLGEGGEMKYDTNINFLLEEFGIMVNNGEDHMRIDLVTPIVVIQIFHCQSFIDDECFVFILCFTVDAVVRNVYYKYFHPKEALVSNGVLNRLVD